MHTQQLDDTIMSNNNSKYKYDPRRRTILKGLAVGGAATLAGGVGAVITSCSAKKSRKAVRLL